MRRRRRVPVASLLAAATNSGLVLLSAWGSNRVLRRFAGHLASISPTFVSATASLSAAALRVQWLPQPAAAADAPALYLLASTDAGDAVAVFSLASGRVVTTLDAVDDDAQHASADNYSPRSPRTSLRCLTVVADRTGLARGPLLLTLDNTSTVTLRACE